MYICMHAHTYMHKYLCMYVDSYVSMYIYTNVCVYVCIYLCVCVYVLWPYRSTAPIKGVLVDPKHRQNTRDCPFDVKRRAVMYLRMYV
jgi:hypothetical protein